MFDVVLDSPGHRKALVIAELQEITGLSNRACARQVAKGGVLFSVTSAAEAERKAEQLRQGGADVRVALQGLEAGAALEEERQAERDADVERALDGASGSPVDLPVGAWRCAVCRGDYGSPNRMSCAACAASGSCEEVRERPADDTDTDTGGADELNDEGLPRELADETRILNYVDIARREFVVEELLDAARHHRDWMMEHGVGDAMIAAARRLPSCETVRDRALLVHAAYATREEARELRHEVPTMDAPQGDPGTKGKGKRRKGGARGPRKSKRSTSWVKRLGVNAVCYRAGFGDDTRLLEMLVAGGYQRRDEDLGAAPEYGFCPIDDPTESTSTWTALPTIGSDPEYVIWGLRRDEKRGCPTHRYRYDAEHQATREARNRGANHASTSAIKELVDGHVTAWYRTATPQTTVIPIVYHRPTFTFSVHSTKQDELDAAVGRIQATLGGITRLASPLNELPVKLACTSVRSDKGTGEGSADVPSDLLLWLVGRQLGGTGTIRLDEGVLEWFLDDAAELARASAPGEKRLRVKLSGSPAEGGSLAAALADGATLQSARLTLRLCEREWHVTVEDGQALAWKLPTLTKADGTPEGLDAAVDERLRLWEQGRHLVDTLVGVFRAERLDGSTWRQRVSALRAQLGIEMVKRWAFDPATGIGFLFAHMLPGEQTTLSSAMSAAKGKRGKKATENGAEARA